MKDSPVESTELDFWWKFATELRLKNSNSRIDHKMFSIFAGPGLGKTWMLNHLAKMSQERINEVLLKYSNQLAENMPTEVKKRFVPFQIHEQFVFVQVDFNGSSSYQEDERDLLLAFDIRFLWRYFILFPALL